MGSSPAELVSGGGVGRLKVAVTVLFELIVTRHWPIRLIELQPLQITGSEPAAGVAVRVTMVPSSNCSVQSMPQSISPGLPVTVPELLPLLLTVRVRIAFWTSKAPMSVPLTAFAIERKSTGRVRSR